MLCLPCNPFASEMQTWEFSLLSVLHNAKNLKLCRLSGPKHGHSVSLHLSTLQASSSSEVNRLQRKGVGEYGPWRSRRFCRNHRFYVVGEPQISVRPYGKTHEELATLDTALAFPSSSNSAYRKIKQNFCLFLWISPETFMASEGCQPLACVKNIKLQHQILGLPCF